MPSGNTVRKFICLTLFIRLSPFRLKKSSSFIIIQAIYRRNPPAGQSPAVQRPLITLYRRGKPASP